MPGGRGSGLLFYLPLETRLYCTLHGLLFTPHILHYTILQHNIFHVSTHYFVLHKLCQKNITADFCSQKRTLPHCRFRNTFSLLVMKVNTNKSTYTSLPNLDKTVIVLDQTFFKKYRYSSVYISPCLYFTAMMKLMRSIMSM